MENPTGYDLNAAIESWRRELPAQTGPAAGDPRELETQLRNTIAELRKRGMDDEESFVLANHRVSPPAQIAPEHVQANPSIVWRERVFWAAIAFLTAIVWQSVVGGVLQPFMFFLRPLLRGVPMPLDSVISITVFAGIWLLSLFRLAVMVSNGRIPRNRKWTDGVFGSRWRFIRVATGVVCALILLRVAMMFPKLGMAIYFAVYSHPSASQLDTLNVALTLFIRNAPGQLALIAVIGWLIPSQKNACRKLAGAPPAKRRDPVKSQAIFDIDTAIETWRRELLAQPHITPGDLRELETHLRDSVAALRVRGMDEEESFVLARHRVGSPRQIASEFVKADPARVWRTRVLWAAVGSLILTVWSMMAGAIENAIFAHIPALSRILYWWPWEFFTAVFAFLPPLCLAVILCNRQIPANVKWIEAIFASRRRFVLAAAGTVCSLFILELAMNIFNLLSYAAHQRHANIPVVITYIFLQGFMFYIAPALALIALIARLIPARGRMSADIA